MDDQWWCPPDEVVELAMALVPETTMMMTTGGDAVGEVPHRRMMAGYQSVAFSLSRVEHQSECICDDVHQAAEERRIPFRVNDGSEIVELHIEALQCLEMMPKPCFKLLKTHRTHSFRARLRLRGINSKHNHRSINPNLRYC